MGSAVSAVTDFVAPITEGAKQINSTVTDSIARSDAGKVAGVVASPLTTTRNIASQLSQGNLDGAKNAAIGGTIETFNMPGKFIRASSTLRDVANSDFGNNITLGWSRDQVKFTDAGSTLVDGQGLSSEQKSDVTRYAIRSAAYGTAIAAGAAYGLGTQVSSYAMANPTSTLVAAKLLSEGRAGDVAAGIVNNYVPGAGELIRDPLNPERAPAGAAPGATYGGAYGPSESYSIPGSMNIGLVAAIGVAIMALMYFIARRK